MSWRRAAKLSLDSLILVCSLAISGVGIAALVASQHDTYLDAGQCNQLSQALSEPCYIRVGVTVTSAEVVRQGKVGPERPQVHVHWDGATPADFILDIPQPTQAYRNLHSGDPATLKVWNGLPTALYNAANAGMRTSYNPLTRDELELWGGASLLGIGLALLAVHQLTTRLLLHRGHTQAKTQRSIFADVQLRVALVALIALQMLDIASSILGGRTGLYESNPVAAAMVQVWGPAGGFFALKLPALIAILLAMTRLPRRVALLLAWATCVVMLAVVVANIALVVNGQPGG